MGFSWGFTNVSAQMNIMLRYMDDFQAAFDKEQDLLNFLK